LTTVASATVRINLPPQVEVTSAPAGFEVAPGGEARVIASVWDDGGAVASYRWTPCEDPSQALSQEYDVVLSPDAVDALRTDRERVVDLCLTVTDGFGDSTEVNVAMQVRHADASTEPPPSPLVPIEAAPGALWLLVLLAGLAAAAVAIRHVHRPPPGGDGA
jgi:hypothetical protein